MKRHDYVRLSWHVRQKLEARQKKARRKPDVTAATIREAVALLAKIPIDPDADAHLDALAAECGHPRKVR